MQNLVVMEVGRRQAFREFDKSTSSVFFIFLFLCRCGTVDEAKRCFHLDVVKQYCRSESQVRFYGDQFILLPCVSRYS